MCKELEKDDAVATDVIPLTFFPRFKRNVDLSISNLMSFTFNIKLQVYMDALGLLLRLDTRNKLDEFLDRLKILASCLTDQVSNASVCLTFICIYLLFFINICATSMFRQCGIKSGLLILRQSGHWVKLETLHVHMYCLRASSLGQYRFLFNLWNFFQWRFLFLDSYDFYRIFDMSKKKQQLMQKAILVCSCWSWLIIMKTSCVLYFFIIS